MKPNKEFMRQAIDEAYEGISNGHGGPFGAIIVKDGEVVGRGHNMVLRNNDCTCHGEMMAIRDACNKLGTFDLSGCEMYTSARCCPMCAGAAQWARLSHVYYACDYDDTTKIGFDDKEFFENGLSEEQFCQEDGQELFDDYMEMNLSRY